MNHHCKDITVLIATSPNESPQSIGAVDIHSPSFDERKFLHWSVKDQCFVERYESDWETSSVDDDPSEEGISWSKATWISIYGVLKILDRSYLVGVTAVEHMKNTEIFRCSGLSWIALPSVKNKHSKHTLKFLTHCESLLDEFCLSECQNLFGSFAQNLCLKEGANINHDIYDVMGFQWNGDLYHQLGSKQYIVPLIYGHVENQVIGGVSFTLVSRRSRFRAGTRYHTRGIDEKGFAAASVETEIIVENPKHSMSASYVLYRGSFPGFWGQPLTGKFNPLVQVINEKHGVTLPEACWAHFDRLRRYYKGNVTILNLLSHRNISPVQEMVKKTMQGEDSILKNITNVINFDFHSYCRLFDFRGVYKIVDSVSEEIDKNGYTLLVSEDGKLSVEKNQTGVVRTNCVDCIDRTNFAQYLLCHYVVRKMLTEVEPGWTHSFEFLRSMWSRNGSALASQYVGTRALYQDAYSMYRSPFSAISDGCVALKRYYQNHILDGHKQDRVTISTKSNCLGPLKYKEIYNSGAELHILLACGILLATFFAWANCRYGVALEQERQFINEQSVFFSKLFSSVWGGVACLLMLSGILLRTRLFSYPNLS